MAGSNQNHVHSTLRYPDDHHLLASLQQSFNALTLDLPGSNLYNNHTNPYFPRPLVPSEGYNNNVALARPNSDMIWNSIINPPLWNNASTRNRNNIITNLSGIESPVLPPVPTCDCCALLSAENLRGRVAAMAKHPTLSSALKSGLSRGNYLFVGPQEIALIFLEVKEQLQQLMVHRHANDVVQKLVEVCNQHQITQLLRAAVRRSDNISFQEICMNPNGSRALQKIACRLETREEKSILISNLVPIALSLIQNPSGYHIIDQCLTSKFSFHERKYLVKQIAHNCVNIATDKCGCIVLKNCIEHAPLEMKHHMACELSAAALTLSQHHFGNYVVQHIIEAVPEVRGKVVAELEGNFVGLSMNKYGSNVIEMCLCAGEEHSTRIITEMMNHPQFLHLIRDDYGNYVVQQALNVSKGLVHKILADLIQLHYRDLHSHPYGKRVLALARGSRRHRLFTQ